jgi:hypothetical protein
MAKPELRPEAFSPTTPASTTAMEAPGCCAASWRAGGQAGIARADDRPVDLQVALQRRLWLARAQQGAPAVGAVIIGQAVYGAWHGVSRLTPMQRSA